jgi:hypothetical protein
VKVQDQPTVKRQSQKEPGLSNLTKVSFRRVKVSQSEVEARLSNAFRLLFEEVEKKMKENIDLL